MVKYATIYKTQREAIASGKKALRTMKVVSGPRGGKIRSSQARVIAIKAIGGYVPIAKRK